MSKLDPKHMQFDAPREWLLIPKDGCKPLEFTFSDLWQQREETLVHGYRLSECHPPCGFTGYKDSEGSKVFGGHILAGFDRLFVVKWDVVQIDKIAPDGTENRVDCASFYFEVLQGGAPLYPIICNFEGKHDLDTLTIIAHILQPDGWTGEVKELLG